LKLAGFGNSDGTGEVAPFTGAWIETRKNEVWWAGATSRTLHGCVD